MKAKEYLQQLEKLNIIIDQKIQEKADLRASLINVSAPDMSKDRVQGGSLPGDSGFAKTLAKIVDLEKEIDAAIDEFVDKKHKIINQIQKLPKAKHIDLLFKRYVQFKKFEEISCEMNITYQYAVELHGYALQEFERTYQNL